MSKEMPGPRDAAEVVEKLIAEGLKVSNYTVEAKEDGLHLTVSLVMPWKEVESK